MYKGMTLQDVAASFMVYPEFKAMYGSNLASITLISRIYANVLHRAPDQAGNDYWVNQLDKQVSTPAAALASFSESDESKTQTAPAIKAGFDCPVLKGVIVLFMQFDTV